MYFRSKRDFTYNLIIWLQVVFLLLLPWINISLIKNYFLLILVISSLYLIYVLSIWVGTGYKIEGGQLLVRSGPHRKKLDISSIKKIEHLKENEGSIVLGPSLSFQRINIYYGDDYNLLSISPEEEEKFIEELQLHNKDITLK